MRISELFRRKKKKDKEKTKEDTVSKQEDKSNIESSNTAPELIKEPDAHLDPFKIDNTDQNTPLEDLKEESSATIDSLQIKEDSVNLKSTVQTMGLDQQDGKPQENISDISEETSKEQANHLKSSEDTDEEISKLLLSIVSGFADYFYDVAEQNFGERPKKIEFTSIRSDRHVGTTGIQLVTVNFSCELGRSRAGLAVKIYNDASEVPPVISKVEFLTQKVQPYYYLGVSTPRIIFTRDQVLVMEGITGESFRHSTVPVTEKYRLAGKCLASLHGSKRHESDLSQYRVIEQQVIATLPLSDHGRSQLTEKFANYPLEKVAANSGAITFGDFHSGNILYQISLFKSPILIAHLIDPEFMQTTPIHDRFADIANFFVNRAINEFQLKGDLFQISRELRSFMAGYNELLAYNLADFKKFYEKSDSISDSYNYHLALAILLSILNLISMPDMSPEYVSQQMKPRITLALMLIDSPSLLG